MKDWKLFYVFECPMAKYTKVVAVKIGITGHPEVRLGVYQNSYSKESHTACLNVAYYGPAKAINGLEKAIKQRFDWSIQRDGRGESEWITGHTLPDMEQLVDEIISGNKFKIEKIKKKFLPLTVDNMQGMKDHYELEV